MGDVIRRVSHIIRMHREELVMRGAAGKLFADAKALYLSPYGDDLRGVCIPAHERRAGFPLLFVHGVVHFTRVLDDLRPLTDQALYRAAKDLVILERGQRRLSELDVTRAAKPDVSGACGKSFGVHVTW